MDIRFTKLFARVTEGYDPNDAIVTYQHGDQEDRYRLYLNLWLIKLFFTWRKSVRLEKKG